MTSVSSASSLLAAAPDSTLAERLECIAQDIEQLHTKATRQIAERLAQAHELFLYVRDEGGFTGWVEKRLGYSTSTAYRAPRRS